MKKTVLTICGFIFFNIVFGQQSDEKYSYVTADFQNILNLTITSDPQVNFQFNSIESYRNGSTQYNAVKLEVDATSAWDLFAYASTDHWTQIDAYAVNGEAQLPAEILEMQAVSPNQAAPPGGTFNSFISLKGVTNSGVVGGLPDAGSTQFLAGMPGTGPGQSYKPGSAKTDRETHTFRVHYRIVPGIGSLFPNSTVPIAGEGYAQPGSYSLEVVFALVQDL